MQFKVGDVVYDIVNNYHFMLYKDHPIFRNIEYDKMLYYYNSLIYWEPKINDIIQVWNNDAQMRKQLYRRFVGFTKTMKYKVVQNDEIKYFLKADKGIR